MPDSEEIRDSKAGEGSQDDERDRVRVALSMNKSDYEELKAIALAEGETVSSYLRKALATERYLKDHANKGHKLIIEENGVQREIIFR